jgi:1-acyl-sn-glycerol-3-phosphate acyltransferase
LVDTVVHAPLVAAASIVAPRASDGITRSWARIMLAGLGVRRSVSGLENLEPGKSYVFICNHQSHVDPPTCLLSLPGHLRFVAKESLFKIPLFGWGARRAGHIPIDRADNAGAVERLNQSLEPLRRGEVSLVMFPEGTRSDDGQLGAFKKGAAVMALRAQVPVVPMAITGSRQVLPKGFNQIHGGDVRLLIGKPIPTAGLTLDDRELLTSRMREEVARLLAQLEGR